MPESANTAASPGTIGPRHLVSARIAGGGAVHSMTGATLGAIESVMIEAESGEIAYAVLSCGGFLGLDSKLFALPWSALSVNSAGRCFLLDSSIEELRSTAGFDPTHWPSSADSHWTAGEIQSASAPRPGPNAPSGASGARVQVRAAAQPTSANSATPVNPSNPVRATARS